MTRIDVRAMTDLLRRLVETDSVNPSLVPGARGEGEIAALLARECQAAGFEVRLDEVMPGRPNVVARLRGRSPGPRLMLNGHTDTVSVDGMDAPFSGVVLGRQLYGRGSYDMKSGLAAMMAAGRAISAEGLPAGELLLTFVIDEEYASLGTTDLIARYGAAGLADATIVTEPTALDVCVAHKGFVWARIETAGRAAHGSRHEDGDDAIIRMGHVLAALDRLDRDVLSCRTHPLLSRPSVHASTIAGGLGLSTYPDRCVLQIERRTLPGETAEAVMAEIDEVLAAARRASPGLVARAELVLTQPWLEVSPDETVVRALADGARAVRGASPQVIGESPWYDAALFGRAGIPTVIFGPAGAGAHAAEEWVDLRSVASCAEILAETVRRFCAHHP